jgi:hypothetical protein
MSYCIVSSPDVAIMSAPASTSSHVDEHGKVVGHSHVMQILPNTRERERNV